MVERTKAPKDLPAQEPAPRSGRLTSDMSLPKLDAVEICSYIAAFVGMWAVLHLRLLGERRAGMLVNQLVHMTSPSIERHTSSRRARWVAVALLATVVVGGLASLALGMIEYFEHTVPNIQNLI